jgi:DNA helicase-2/ATP-dependent DNA helicase PcrA
MEEERRLCYVGMTRAEKKLYLSWARYRRRFGGGQPEACIPSRFLKEVPPSLLQKMGADSDMPQVELHAERSYVRETAKRNLYTGKTYNSLENIAQYFAERGIAAPRPPAPPAPTAPPRPPAAAVNPAARPAVGSAGFMQPRPPVPPPSKQQQQPAQRQMFGAGAFPPAPVKKKKFGAGSVVNHPKYGKGTVMRVEGEGDDAKLTISFPGHGLKKIVQKYAGIRPDE